MSCATCANNRTDGKPRGCKNNGTCSSGGCNKLGVFDWLAGLERAANQQTFDCVEVRFKNTRKEFFKNSEKLDLNVGDAVAVEATSGHDIGVVSLTGELVKIQMNKYKIDSNSREVRKIYRKAHQQDLDKWKEARDLEQSTMFEARKMVALLKLDMKIGDVEYQGDKTRATFYYTADARVDFRELIRMLADTFKIRVEMKQIGARQEAGRIGGIGSCGRELCCSTWLTDFRSVSTNAARYQQLSLNPLKLAGQCGKLKCCLNYELDAYMDALKHFPKNTPKLNAVKGDAFHQKTDIFRGIMWYSYYDEPDKFIPLEVDRVKEIIALNQEGKKPEDIAVLTEILPEKKPDYENVVGQDSLTRFDKPKKKKGKRFFKGNKNNRQNRDKQ